LWVGVRRMLPDELEAAVGVWRAANVARGAPHGAERTARIREKLSASDALAFVALGPEIVGMALAEPGRFDDGAGVLDPTLLHISMVFVHPATQGTGVGRSLVLHVLDAARSLGYQRAGVVLEAPLEGRASPYGMASVVYGLGLLVAARSLGWPDAGEVEAIFARYP
jgi:ribosomal protein S18 acetylase RimI-like enzyme